MIARNFEIELDDGGPVTELFGFITVPSELRVRLRERRRHQHTACGLDSRVEPQPT
jgi:hypothetical protein